MSLPRDHQQIDALSAASAGMLALGVPTDRRVHAIRLLAEMLDRADADGRVNFDDGLYAIEQRLGVDECIDAYAWFEATGVAARTRTGWLIKGIDANRLPAGANAASVAILARHIAENRAESNTAVSARKDAPAPSAGAAQLASITPIGVARPRPVAAPSLARRLPVMAGSLAAAAALVLGFVSFANRPDNTNSRGDLASRSQALRDAAAKPAVTVGGVTSAVPNTAPGATAPASVVAPVAPTAPGGVACLLPDIRVLSVDVAAVPGVLTGTEWTALVAGTVTNTSPYPATLDGVKVLVDLGAGAVVEGTALLSATKLDPGASGTFSSLIPAGSVEPLNPVATVAATNWKTSGC